ncbi:MAG: hypothetical protein MHM6MM_008740, partial [Cercozoa sp. M6MM]
WQRGLVALAADDGVFGAHAETLYEWRFTGVPRWRRVETRVRRLRAMAADDDADQVACFFDDDSTDGCTGCMDDDSDGVSDHMSDHATGDHMSDHVTNHVTDEERLDAFYLSRVLQWRRFDRRVLYAVLSKWSPVLARALLSHNESFPTAAEATQLAQQLPDCVAARARATEHEAAAMASALDAATVAQLRARVRRRQRLEQRRLMWRTLLRELCSEAAAAARVEALCAQAGEGVVLAASRGGVSALRQAAAAESLALAALSPTVHAAQALTHRLQRRVLVNDGDATDLLDTDDVEDGLDGLEGARGTTDGVDGSDGTSGIKGAVLELLQSALPSDAAAAAVAVAAAALRMHVLSDTVASDTSGYSDLIDQLTRRLTPSQLSHGVATCLQLCEATVPVRKGPSLWQHVATDTVCASVTARHVLLRALRALCLAVRGRVALDSETQGDFALTSRHVSLETQFARASALLRGDAAVLRGHSVSARTAGSGSARSGSAGSFWSGRPHFDAAAFVVPALLLHVNTPVKTLRMQSESDAFHVALAARSNRHAQETALWQALLSESLLRPWQSPRLWLLRLEALVRHEPSVDALTRASDEMTTLLRADACSPWLMRRLSALTQDAPRGALPLPLALLARLLALQVLQRSSERAVHEATVRVAQTALEEMRHAVRTVTLSARNTVSLEESPRGQQEGQMEGQTRVQVSLQETRPDVRHALLTRCFVSALALGDTAAALDAVRRTSGSARRAPL